MYHDPSQFEIARVMESNYDLVVDVLQSIPRTQHEEPRNYNHNLYLEKVLRDNRWTYFPGTEGWLTFMISYKEQFPADPEGRLDPIRNLLSQFDGLHLCAFSIMKPSTVIPIHTHDELIGTDVLSYHLALSGAPKSSYLSVGNGFYEEIPGHSLVLDTVHPHFAVNASATDERAIIYIEFEQHRMPKVAATEARTTHSV